MWRCILLVGLIHLAAAGVIWSDEFNGNSLDYSNWNVANGNPGVNNERECYTRRSDNVKVGGGYLTLTAKTENYGGCQYTSGKITSNHGLGPLGTIQIRAKLPSGQGLWPALWNYGGPTWPQKGEIDVMELRGHQPNIFLTTLHWGNRYNDKTSYGSTINADCDLSHDWHIWSFVRSSNKRISFSFDGQTYASWDYNTLHNHASQYYVPFWDKAESVIFNIAVGGDFLPGNEQPYPGIHWPKGTMEVDYIRYLDNQDHAPFANLTDVKYRNITLGGYGNVTMGVGASVHCKSGPGPSPGPTPTPSPGNCTPQDDDPYSSGNFVQCCPRTKKCLYPWDGSPTWSYRCKICSWNGCKNSDAQCMPGDENLENIDFKNQKPKITLKSPAN